MSGPRNPSYTLVVFGGSIYDIALAIDFVATSKKFMADGLNPTCISGTDISGITDMVGPLFFGRDDLRNRVQVYDSQEAMNPFYRMAGPEGLKANVLNWIQNVSLQLRPGDRVVIMFVAYGESQDANIQLTSQRGKEFLTRTEVTAALSALPRDIRILLISEACYSGPWATVAVDVGAGRDVMVETASSIGEKSYNYRSASGKFRCALFATAFIEEITTYPEGRFVNHHTRKRDELKYVAGS